MIWTVCGAGKGVGKTTLVNGLLNILPDSVYIKHGHGALSPKKTANFFVNAEDARSAVITLKNNHENVIIESNTLAKEGFGDLIIFIDGVSKKLGRREDADILFNKSQIQICWVTTNNWQAVLSEKMLPKTIINQIIEIFINQRLHNAFIEVESRIWFELDKNFAIGAGLSSLLQSIQEHGTLKKAAKEASISYRHAWNLIKNAEQSMGIKLISSHTGGSKGGSTELSIEGKRLLTLYLILRDDVQKYANKRLYEIMANLDT